MIRVPHYGMNRKTLDELLLLDQRRELNEGDKINFKVGRTVVNEAVISAGSSHFETARYGVDGKAMTTIPTFLYNSNGCILMSSHSEGTPAYDLLLKNLEAREHA
ncbi:MAG: hypothetical protein RL557_439 [archaeon]|jgi:hypothetical protein